MLDRFGGKLGPPTLYAVQSCMLAAQPVESERASRVIEEEFRLRSSENPKATHLGYTQLIMALADYRCGRYAHAADLAKGLHGTGRRLEIEAEIILAMAAHRLGDKVLARQSLAAAVKAVSAGLDAHDEWDGHWLDWLACDALLREAKALVDMGASPTGESPASNLSVALDYPYVDILLRAGKFDEAITAFREAALRKPDDRRIDRKLGELLAERGRWQEALKFLQKATELDLTDDFLWLQVCTLHLYLGDDAGYRRYTLAMIDRFGLTDADQGPSARTRKSCLVSPRPVEFERVYPLMKQWYANIEASNPKAEQYGWADLDRALAEYRKGHYDQAASHLKRCRAARGVCGLQAESLLAMTYKRLGLEAEAGRLLAACRQTLKEVATRPSGWGFDWHDYLTCEMFCREAEVLMRDDPERSK
jgi:tetratricopeptide (TPR) repeat protein